MWLQVRVAFSVKHGNHGDHDYHGEHGWDPSLRDQSVSLLQKINWSMDYDITKEKYGMMRIVTLVSRWQTADMYDLGGSSESAHLSNIHFFTSSLIYQFFPFHVLLCDVI